MADNLRGAVAAHTLIYHRHRYPLSVASIDERGQLVIAPLVAETPRTCFINGEVEIELVDGVICAKPCNTESEQLSHR